MNICNQLPIQFQERLELLYGKEKVSDIYAAFSDKLIPSFRINTIKANSEDIQSALKTQGYTIKQVPWYKDAFLLNNKSIRELTETTEYKDGLIYIQNLSSMIPALVLDPQHGDKILDLAAAPGSKTTQIAALMNNTGEITANDLSRKRLYKLKENINSMGIINTQIVNFPGESFWKRLPQYFDKTLVDVPCSMEGRIKCNDPKTYKDWSTKKVKQLSKLQKYLLRSAVSATKVGGVIVYSTCTLSPEENEEVLEWVIKKANGAIKLEEISLPPLQFSSGLKGWGKKEFSHTVKACRIIPSLAMEGFFIAKIRKISSTLPLPI